MSRLTERTRFGIVGNNDRVINYPLYKIADADPLDRRIVGQCFEKLADYEDAEEQCIKETSFGFKELLHKWKTFTDDVQELLEYRRLEEQGLLLRLPCKVGDTVWCIVGIKVIECTVLWIEWHRNGAMVFSLDGGLGDVVLAHIGERWFTTKEEAEQKLESMKGE